MPGKGFAAMSPERRRELAAMGGSTPKVKGSKRGFAAMDPAKQRAIASLGGKASHGGGRKPWKNVKPKDE